MTNNKTLEEEYNDMRRRYPCDFGKDDHTCGCGNCCAISAWMEAAQDDCFLEDPRFLEQDLEEVRS